jgi:hypothetical protein
MQMDKFAYKGLECYIGHSLSKQAHLTVLIESYLDNKKSGIS